MKYEVFRAHAQERITHKEGLEF